MATKYPIENSKSMSKLKLGLGEFFGLLRDCPLFSSPGEQLLMFVIGSHGTINHGFGPWTDIDRLCDETGMGGVRCNGTSMPWSPTEFFMWTIAIATPASSTRCWSASRKAPWSPAGSDQNAIQRSWLAGMRS